MAGKLKGFDPKKLAVDHGEKIAFGAIVLLVLAALVTTNWMPYPKAPEDITRKVDDAQSKLSQGTWPEDEQQKFVLTEERVPEQVIDAGLHRRIEVAGYTPSQRMAKPLHDLDNPLQEPVLVPVRKLIAAAARVFVEERPDPTELASATDGTAGEGTATTADPKTDENVSDEFRQRGAGGAGAGYPAGGYPGYGGGGIAGLGQEIDYGSMDAPELDMAAAYGGMDYLMGGMMMGGEGYGPGMGSGPKVKGRGYPFVSVRGLFEFKDQVRKIAEAIHKPEAEAYQKFGIIDFELQRQLLEVAPDTWSDWEKVDIQVLRDVIDAANGLAPDPVQSAVTDSAITSPLPQRVYGAWFNHATHPDLKEFQLSEAEMEQELKFNYALIQSFKDSKKDLPPEPVQKRGFSDMVFDARQLQQGMMGAGSAYDMMGMAGMGSMMMEGERSMGAGIGPGYGAGASSGYPGPAAYGGGAQGAVAGDKDFQKLVDNLAKVVDPDQRDQQLREFIAKRARAEGSRLLFRYIDFDVVPGRTYRYRVRLELRNPNFGANIAAAGGQADVVAGETRMTPWSEPTAATLVEDTVKYFVTRVEPARGSRLHPDVRMNVFQYDQQMGTIVNSQVSAAFGHNVGGKAKARQADPAQQTNEEKEYTFKSNDVLVDAVPDLKFGAPEHADLKLPPATRGYAQAAELALLVTPDQTLKDIDPTSQQGALAEAVKHYNDQMTFMDTLIRTAPAYGEGMAGDDLAGLYAGAYGGMMGEEMGGGGMSRGRNPLRKGRGGRGGMMGMDGMGGGVMMPPGSMPPGSNRPSGPGRGRGGPTQRNPR